MVVYLLEMQGGNLIQGSLEAVDTGDQTCDLSAGT